MNEIANLTSGDKLDIADAITRLTDCIHNNAVYKGFWSKERNDGEAIALMHSELSEALEAMRDGNPKSEKIPNFSAVEEELADCIIRILDFAGGRRLDVAGAIIDKMYYNAGRPHLHGRKF